MKASDSKWSQTRYSGGWQEAEVERRGWWAWGRIPGLAAGLLLLERELLGLVGTPKGQLRTLQLAGGAPADPVAAVIAVLAVMAETLVGYLGRYFSRQEGR